MNDLTELSLTEIIFALRKGEISCRALTAAYLDRIKQFDPALHTFLYVDEKGALSKADSIDNQWLEWQKTGQDTLPPLHGIPVAIKDILCVSGMPCTCGSRILEGFAPPYNATVVERLIAAGAIVLGKTNTDEFAMGSSTENSGYGVTHNPWDVDRVPGGSSGGSAAAVAANFAPVALGTDTGGSVRHPAAFTGVVAIKPTYGRVSRFGLVAFGSSLDSVGAFGRTVEDAAVVFQVIAGHDRRDATSMEIPLPEIELKMINDKPLAGLRVGIPAEYFVSGMQSEVETSVRQAIEALEVLGAELVQIHLPHTEYALPVYYIIAPAEASANLARYDGIRYGVRLPAESMWEIYRRTRGEEFGPEVKRRIMLGTYALSAGYYDAYYGQAQKVRTLIRQDFEQAFAQVDLIAAPVTPTTAFRIGEHSGDPLSMYLEDIFTLPANLAGIPGLTFPVGFDNQNLPIGMQLMAPHFEEARLFLAGHAYQQVTDWHRRRPLLVQNN